MVPRGAVWWVAAGILGGLAVVIGAFGAHGLQGASRNWPEENRTRRLENWETGARYHMYHALALAGVGWLAASGAGRWATASGCCFLGGLLLFSGALYAYTLTGQRFWGAIAPIGGSLLILGWICWTCAALTLWQNHARQPAPQELSGSSHLSQAQQAGHSRFPSAK
jgi:uncharacterized membrane protein YgdD (TMEM256/DUF423 family)